MLNIDKEMNQQCSNDDIDLEIDELSTEVNQNNSIVVQELDDAYAHQYFRKFELNPDYDRNATMPVDEDGSFASSNAVRQYCKERGLSYIRINGLEEPARQIKEACMCRKRCYMKFMDDVRSKLLNNLLGLSALGQRKFFSSHITTVAIQRPRFKYCPRKSRHIYHLPSNSGLTQVCMRMFANTFDITDKKLRILFDKIDSGTLDSNTKSIISDPNYDEPSLQSASNRDDEEMEIEKDPQTYESHKDINFIDIPEMRNLGDMEEYFLRYETDVDFQSRAEQSILQSKLGKPTAKKMQAENMLRKARGYAYIRCDGTEAPARKLKAICSCRLMCWQRISKDARQVLLNNLLDLSVEGQENFLYSHIHLKRSSLLRSTMDHFLPTKSELIRVCKVMFMNTFDVTDKKIRMIIVRKRSEDQKVLGVDNDDLAQAAVDSEPELSRSEGDNRDEVSESELDDEIEIKHSNELLEAKSENESIDSKIGIEEELVNDPREALETHNQNNCTAISHSDPEAVIDDAFLEEYFHRYETNRDQERPGKKINKWTKKIWFNNGTDETPPEPCNCMVYNCCSWFTDVLRQKMFTRFSKLSPLNKKRFLFRHISKENIRRTRVCESRRSFSMFYFIPTKTSHVKVCKVMFMNTFKVTDRGLRTILGSERASVEDFVSEEESVEPDDVVDDDFSMVEEDSSDIPQRGTGIEKHSDPEGVIDDAFLQQYFHRYETNRDQEKPGKNINKWTKIISCNDGADETPLESCKCIVYNCSTWFTDGLRQKMFTRFSKLSPLNKKRFLFHHVRKENIRRTRVCLSRRRFSMFYFIPTKKGHVKVCRIMFLNTFKTTDKRLRTILDSELDSVEDFMSEEESIEPDDVVDDDVSIAEGDCCDILQRETDNRDEIAASELDDEIEIKHSNELLEAKSENESNDSTIGIEEESVNDPKEAIETHKQNHCTAIPNSDPEVLIDDAFLQEYFHRYETNRDQERPGKKKNNWAKKIWLNYGKDKTLPGPCNCVVYNCSSWFTDDLRQKLFARFLKLSPLNKKRFLFRHISKENTRRSRTPLSRRSFSMFYFIPTKKGHVKVCKVMFMNTFKATHRRLRTISDSELASMEDFVSGDESFEPEDVVDDDVSVVEEDSCDILQQGTDPDTDSAESSPPLPETLISGNSQEGCNGPVEPKICDEAEEQELKTRPEDGENQNCSPVVYEDSCIPVFDNMFGAASEMEEESDDAFLEQYFHRYETNFGQEEATYAKDKSMRKSWYYNSADETLNEPCNCVYFKCSTWFKEDFRQKLFTRYFRLSGLNKKRFLYRHIRKEHKRRSYLPNSRRNFSMYYFVPTKKGYAKVCKVMFMNTFKVSDKKLRLIVANDKYSDPVEVTTSEEPTCIKLDPDDFLVDMDENCLGRASDDVEFEDTSKPGAVIEENPESSSTITDDLTESCNEDDKLPFDYTESVGGSTVTKSKPRPVVELDDEFLTEYFRRYETSGEKHEPDIGRPRKPWIKHDSLGSIPPPCSCTRTCCATYPDDVRLEINARFAKLSSLNQKRFLFRHIKQVNLSKKKNSPVSRRQKTWFYYLPAKIGPIKVCRVMFINTFNITEKKLRVLVGRKEFAEYTSDNDRQATEHVPSSDTISGAFHVLNEDHNYRTEGIDNTAAPTAERITDELPEYVNYFAQVAESAVDPLLSLLGCSVPNNTFTVAEMDETFLDEYFHQFGRNAAKESNGKNGLQGFPPIACACHRKCHMKFPDQIRQLILDRYAGLSTTNRIRFLSSHVKKETPRHSMDQQSIQCSSYLFYLPSKSGHVRVCDIMFLNTFHITDAEVREIVFCEAASSQQNGSVKTEIKTEADIKIENHFASEKSVEMIAGYSDHGLRSVRPDSPPEELLTTFDRTTETPAPDDPIRSTCFSETPQQNETNSKRPEKINNTAIRFAREHICGFPRITAHFCQKINKTKYMSCFLDVTRMYIAYIKACTERSEEPLPSNIYNAILRKERTKDPVLPTTCDICQHEEKLDLDEDNSLFRYEDEDD